MLDTPQRSWRDFRGNFHGDMVLRRKGLLYEALVLGDTVVPLFKILDLNSVGVGPEVILVKAIVENLIALK